MNVRPVVVWTALVLILAGCATPWMLQPRVGEGVPVKGVSIAGGDLVLYQQDQQRSLNLSDVRSLTLDASRVRTDGGKVQYAATVVFLQGPGIGSDTANPAWLDADLVLHAKAPGGSLAMPVSGLRSLSRMDKAAYSTMVSDTSQSTGAKVDSSAADSAAQGGASN